MNTYIIIASLALISFCLLFLVFSHKDKLEGDQTGTDIKRTSNQKKGQKPKKLSGRKAKDAAIGQALWEKHRAFFEMFAPYEKKHFKFGRSGLEEMDLEICAGPAGRNVCIEYYFNFTNHDEDPYEEDDDFGTTDFTGSSDRNEEGYHDQQAGFLEFREEGNKFIMTYSDHDMEPVHEWKFPTNFSAQKMLELILSTNPYFIDDRTEIALDLIKSVADRTIDEMDEIPAIFVSYD